MKPVDMTRELTLEAKKGYRDGRAWGWGDWYLWASLIRVERDGMKWGYNVQVGVFGIAFLVGIISTEYRGG